MKSLRKKREAGNQKALKTESLAIKRFYDLDKTVYADGALSSQDKELLGLVASMVLRCNDCIDYHLEQCVAKGWQRKQIDEAMAVAMMVGGSIVIPHTRHAAETLEYLFTQNL
ncbi:MAG: carboxymuconolactone decarboxylase family protein [Proteobacteria bacterium]|nr:carboxymuconolactone decarboxylase family protein [Pseudomonadota bacterium]